MVNTGYKQNLKFANETTYGSASAVNQPIGLVQSVNPTETNTLIKIRTMGGSRDYSNIVPGKFDVKGSFEYYIQGGAFLRMAMSEDTASTATVDSGPKRHTGAALASACLHCMGSAASPLADSFPSFTLEFADSEDSGAAGSKNLKRTYTGCRVDSLTISGSVDEPVRVSCDWIAQGVTVSTGAATSVTEDTVDPYVFYQGWVYSSSGTSVSANSTFATSCRIAEVNSFDFTVSNNLEPAWYVSGTTNTHQTLRGLKNLLAKGRDYESTLNLHFKNKTMYQRFLGNDTATQSQGTLNKYQIVIDFVRTGTIGGVKTITDDFLRIWLKDCAFNDINIAGAPEDIVSQNIGVNVEAAKIWVVDRDVTYK